MESGEKKTNPSLSRRTPELPEAIELQNLADEE